ncbi:zf-HC2 domain-containing protein [candidate division KSB1 bacterium]|nr:zf-HC2 domain-containing protein [candidate division KSB1 bacterium]
MQCPQGEIFFQFLENILAPEQQKSFLNHLMQCQVCSQKLIFINQVQRHFHKINGDKINPKDCCSVDVLSAFVDGYLTPEENQKIIEHLMECKTCLQKLLVLKDILQTNESSPIQVPPKVWTKVNRFGYPKGNDFFSFLVSTDSWRRFRNFITSFLPILNEIHWPYWVSMGTAIIILLLVAYFPFSSPLDERFTIQVIYPNAEINTDCPVFKWKGAKGIRQYYVEVKCENQQKIVWQTQTKQTSIQFPINTSPKLDYNQPYLWYVRGERKAGEIVSSDSGRFYIASASSFQGDLK